MTMRTETKGGEGILIRGNNSEHCGAGEEIEVEDGLGEEHGDDKGSALLDGLKANDRGGDRGDMRRDAHGEDIKARRRRR